MNNWFDKSFLSLWRQCEYSGIMFRYFHHSKSAHGLFMHPQTIVSTPTQAACRICGNSEGNLALELHGGRDEGSEMFVYDVCAVCGCMQIDRIPEDMGRYYNNSYYSYKHLDRFASSRLSRFFNSRRVSHALGRRNLIGFLVNAMSRPVDYLDWTRRAGASQQSRILDVGCGSGKLLLRMHQGGFRNCIGMDPYIEQKIEYSCGVRVEKLDIREDVKDPNHDLYDLIMLHHSFEHLEHPLESLQAARKLLSPKGCILIRLPICDSYAWETYGDDWAGLSAPRHFFLHTKKSMGILAQQANLVLSDVVYDAVPNLLLAGVLAQRGVVLKSGERRRDYFTKEELTALQRQTDELNAQQRGDQAGFYLRLP